MKSKIISTYDKNYLFVSTPKQLKTYNGKNVINLCLRNIDDIFNEFNVGDVYWYIKIDISANYTQSVINKIYNGSLKMFDKYLIIDKGLILCDNYKGNWHAYTSFLCMNGNKELTRLNYYQLNSKDYTQQQLIRYFKNAKQHFEKELSSLDKDKDKIKYRNRVRVIQQCSELIEKLPRLFV